MGICKENSICTTVPSATIGFTGFALPNVTFSFQSGMLSLSAKHAPFQNLYHGDMTSSLTLVHLTIFLQYCCYTASNMKHSQSPLVILYSDAENTLKAAIMLMLKGKVSEGKTLFLHLLQSSLNLTINGSKYNYFGGENDRCLCLFTHIWKLIVKQNVLQSIVQIKI